VPETLEVHCSRAAISAMVHGQVIPPLGELNPLVIAARRAIKVQLRHVKRAANTAVVISIAVQQSFNILCPLAAALAAA
jgi:hypothetical protein